MKVFTYSGETPSDALKKATSAHGLDPIVIETKEIRKKTLTQKGLYEVIIAVEEKQEAQNSIKKRLDEIVEKRKQEPKFPVIDDEVLKPKLLPPQERVQSPKHHSHNQGQNELKAIKKEMEQIDDRLKLIQSMMWEEKKPQNHSLKIPKEFAEIYNIAKSSGMDLDKLNTIMEISLESMPLQMRSNSVTIKRFFREVLRKMIACRRENLDVSSKNIMMFVGPTGVGKTTTLAKLAARYSLMLNKRYKVGVITLDSYKIAAMEQLMTYARMMKLGMERVDDPQELVGAIEKLRYCDFILIDTAGHSQYDMQKLETLKRYLSAEYKIDVSLVLSTNTKYEDLKDIYQCFSAVSIDNLIFSKLDESRTFGNIFSLASEVKTPISYFSIGQRVPNDLLVATNEFLVDCLLEGFHPMKKESK